MPQNDPPPPTAPRLFLRLVFDQAHILGPGKIDLLGRIASTGSIAAAGRDMGMSYKRAWDLVAAMNAMFATPLVAAARGGAGGGGAAITPTGRQVLALYDQILTAAAQAGAEPLAALSALLANTSNDK